MKKILVTFLVLMAMVGAAIADEGALLGECFVAQEEETQAQEEVQEAPPEVLPAQTDQLTKPGELGYIDWDKKEFVSGDRIFILNANSDYPDSYFGPGGFFTKGALEEMDREGSIQRGTILSGPNKNGQYRFQFDGITQYAYSSWSVCVKQGWLFYNY